MFLNKIINTVYSIGAAVVVFGAWAKLENKSFSGIALTSGLLTEVGIFCLYGLLEWRKEPAAVHPAHASKVPDEVKASNGVEVEELTATMRQTNNILNKVFKAE